MKKLSIGIVGLPNVGKSTLFKVLTKQEVNIANYPFATIDPNVGVVTVPDERLDKLTAMSKSKKIIPAVVEFYDIAGLVKGANKGEGLGNQFLSNIKEVRAIVQVVRVFKSGEILHVENNVNPMRDIEIINSELILKDLENVGNRRQRLEKEAKTGDKQKAKDLETLKKVYEGLNNGLIASKLDKEIISEPIIEELNLLTAKAQIYLLNGLENEVDEALKSKIKSLGADYLILDLNSVSEANALITKAYEVLGLISFLTTGEDETRAWTIGKTTKAPQAAGVIHSDFEDKFIRAEVVNWVKLLEAGSWFAAKQKGWLRIEGKDYIVEDGDVIEVRHG
ncbi:MAG: redox-regulated ATPase YchF [Candidatus Colwellbacteria bacterium]|nr:redox-regulated ATPase YchF [Candidatus Colwellbacteria bacterium]MBI3274212.1 redox-regulated ATPase YchF [Candidatus Colwellbacteria bacterium]